jgi:hypothetical protein
MATPKMVRAIALTMTDRLFSLTHWGNGEGVITSTCHNCLAATEWGLDVTFENFPHDEDADCVRAREAAMKIVSQIPEQ